MIEEIKLVEPELVENCKCENITKEEAPEMIELGKKMIEYCFRNGAVGLSAPQIGIYKNMFVYRKTEDSFQIIINPSYIKLSKKPMKVLESCLTYKDKSFLVERYKEIQAIFYVFENNNLYRKGMSLKGEKAIVFQHESDHLVGKTIKTVGVPSIG